MENYSKKLIVLTSPSGGGKSTLARYLMKKYSGLKFSVSATTRAKRPRETDGKDYFFLSKEEFRFNIDKGRMIEYEEIFGNYYGSLRSEVENALKGSYKLLFDVDVKGALSLRKAYPDDTLLIFINPPSVEVLKERLLNRNTELFDEISRRLERAKMEINQANLFDIVIVNKDLAELYKAADEVAKLYDF